MNNNISELDIEKCRAESLAHIADVTKNIYVFVKELLDRAAMHDASQLQEPELSGCAAATMALKDIEYGSEEYKVNLQTIRPVIEHHYSKNRHHPESRADGIDGMTLIDLLEMLADWASATKRNKNGNLYKSVYLNAVRFHMAPQLQHIFENTVREHFRDQFFKQ